MASEVSTKAVAEYVASLIANAASLEDVRTSLGLGSMAEQNSTSVVVSGGSLSGVAVSATSLLVTAGPVRVGSSGEVSLARLAITGAASAAAFSAASQALYASGDLTGSGPAPYGVVSVNDLATGSGQTFVSALFLAHNINGGAAGNRSTLLPVLTKSTSLGGTDPLKKFYLPLFPQFYINAGDGGTSLTDWRGDHYGFGSLVQAQSGAKWLNSVIGAEIDVSMQANTSAKYKVGLQIVSVNSDAVKGYTAEAMLVLTRDASTTAKWNNGILFGFPYGLWPFEDNATIIGTYGTGLAAGVGLDFSAVTFGTAALKSAGFSVGPTGAVTGLSLAAVNAAGAASLRLSGNGADPDKYLRSYDGNLDVLDSLGTSVLLSLTDEGQLSLNMTAMQDAVDDAAAATAGVSVGGVYRNGSALMVRAA